MSECCDNVPIKPVFGLAYTEEDTCTPGKPGFQLETKFEVVESIDESNLVHKSGSETITGQKDFTVSPTVPLAVLPEAPVPLNQLQILIQNTNRAQTFYLVDADDNEISRITTDGIGKTQIFSSSNVLLFELSETEIAVVPEAEISAVIEPPVALVILSFVGGTDTLTGGTANLTLDASSSYSPDGSPVTVEWETTSGTFI